MSKRNTRYGNMDIKPGDRFGKLVVIKEVERKYFSDGSPTRQWLCKCDCGNEKVVVGRYLKRGETKSCGHCPIIKREDHVHYSRASKILDRCNNSNSSAWKWYGKRGIKCELGNTAYEVALSLDKVPGYFDGAYIDRIDYNGNYTLYHPDHGYNTWIYYDQNLRKNYQAIGNLRWLSATESCMNKCDNVTIELLRKTSRTDKDFRRSCKAHGWDPDNFNRIKDITTRNQWFYIIK